MQQKSSPNLQSMEAPPAVVELVDPVVRPRSLAALVVSLVIILVLLAAALLTPPISLGDRLAEIGYQHVGSDGAVLRQADGTELVIAKDAWHVNTPIKMGIIPLADFISKAPADLQAATTFPPRLTLKSAIYTFDTRHRTAGDARLSMLIPTDVKDEELTVVDLYAWDGVAWQWQPTTVLPDDDQIYTTLASLPKAVALFAVSAPRATVSALLSSPGALADDAADVLSEITLPGLWVDADGSLKGTVEDITPVRGARYLTLPTVQNLAADKWDGDLVANIVQNNTLRRSHIMSLANLADKPTYAGVNIDYRRLPANAEDRDNFSAFVAELADELHNRRKILIVTLEAPTRVSDDPRPEFAWNTGGYDWVAIGQASDAVRVVIPAEMGDQLLALQRVLAFATTQVSRQKLQPVIPVTSSVVGSQGVSSISYDEALKMAAAIEVVNPPQQVVAGESSVTLRHTYLVIGDSKTPFYWDGQARQYRFAFKDRDGIGTVWLQNGLSVGYKLEALALYAVKGVVLRDPTIERMDPAAWAAARIYAASGHSPVAEPTDKSLRTNWQASGGELAPGTLMTEVTWKAPKEAGRYTISSSLPPNLSDRGGQTVSIEVVAPTPTPLPTPTPAPTPTPVPPTPTPVPVVVAAPAPTRAPVVAAPAVGKYGFGYGVQAHMIQNDHGPIINAVAGMGFGWIKQQVEWIVYEPSKGNFQWGELDRLVNSANAAGIKVLFSVLRSPKWANAEPDGPPQNFNDLGDFFAAMASRYKGRVHAYEVWNEQNLAREWRGHGLSASRYVELLRICYNRIKAADPDAVVVAGALTPTGVNDPAIAIDDRLFLRQMYEAGLRGVSDAVGVHPSGFANPPDSSWPNNLSAAPSHNNHPSFYFRNTMEDYHNIMVEYGDGRKQLWPTEFGWAVSASPHPGYEYAAYNNEGTRAQWLVRAYQMGKSWGWVGPMFLWNLNFRIVAPGSEQAAFGIMDPGWRATASWAALRDMPK